MVEDIKTSQNNDKKTQSKLTSFRARLKELEAYAADRSRWCAITHLASANFEEARRATTQLWNLSIYHNLPLSLIASDSGHPYLVFGFLPSPLMNCKTKTSWNTKNNHDTNDRFSNFLKRLLYSWYRRPLFHALLTYTNCYKLLKWSELTALFFLLNFWRNEILSIFSYRVVSRCLLHTFKALPFD